MLPTQARQSKIQNEPLASEEQAFERQRARLLRHYANQFVAIYHGRVVGHDKDAEALAARLFKELGDVPFLIARVEKGASAYDLPSPEGDW
jgi:hypothetical protein